MRSVTIRYLHMTARRLKPVVRDSDPAGRLGGDNFVIAASGRAAGHEGQDAPP